LSFGLLSDPLGELTALPRPPSWIMGKGGEIGEGMAGGGGMGRGRKGENEGRGGREREKSGEGNEGKGRVSSE